MNDEAILKIEIKSGFENAVNLLGHGKQSCFRCGSQINAVPVYCGTNSAGGHRVESLCERCQKRLQAAIQAVANDFLDSERRRE